MAGEARDYTLILTVVYPDATEDQANAMIDGLHGYVQQSISPLTGQWTLETIRQLLDEDWSHGWPVKKRSYWRCERCDKPGRPGDIAIRQRCGRMTREVCEACGLDGGGDGR